MNNNAVKLLRALVEISVKNPAPRKAEYAGSWKSFLIAVDKDNTAEILMPEEVYNKLLEVKVSPTPREQELEAENKALWELVEECRVAVQYTLDIKGGTWALDAIHKQANITLAAIQKAKEAI